MLQAWRRRIAALGRPAVEPPPVLQRRPRPWIMAHRGASSRYPENTMAAFRAAIDEGADMLETDLWRCGDGTIVCHHDATLERVWGDPRRVDHMSVIELKALRLAGRLGDLAPDARIPTLAELLDVVPPDVVLALEIKDERLTRGPGASALGRLLREAIDEQRVFAMAFDLAWLSDLRQVVPDLAVGHITTRRVLPTQWTELIGVGWPLIYHNPLYVPLAHLRGRWVAPLDPALHDHLDRYVAMGVDAVLTDDPAETRRRIVKIRAWRRGAGRSQG